jgi:hypothetical protein
MGNYTEMGPMKSMLKKQRGVLHSQIELRKSSIPTTTRGDGKE